MMERKKEIKHFRDLVVYQRAFNTAMRIYKITKNFPKEEIYSLVDQIRRSSRSVCSNLAEAWRKMQINSVLNKLLTSQLHSFSISCFII